MIPCFNSSDVFIGNKSVYVVSAKKIRKTQPIAKTAGLVPASRDSEIDTLVNMYSHRHNEVKMF